MIMAEIKKISEKEEEKQEKPQEIPKPVETRKISFPGIKLFGLWDTAGVRVEDPGLKRYINLRPLMVPRSGGRYAREMFYRNEASIVERFLNKLAVSGHKGKKHRLTSGHCSGGKQNLLKATREAFKIIEQRTKQNPVQVLVRAIENSSILEEVAAYRMGGIIARKAVVVSPKRRLDIALRYMAQGIFRAGFKRKATLAETIARELMAAASGDSKSFPIMEKNRIEKEAEGAR